MEALQALRAMERTLSAVEDRLMQKQAAELVALEDRISLRLDRMQAQAAQVSTRLDNLQTPLSTRFSKPQSRVGTNGRGIDSETLEEIFDDGHAKGRPWRSTTELAVRVPILF